jgi:hypothetical protein
MTETQLARRLGTTPAGLRALAKAVANGGIVPRGQGAGWAFVAVPGLERRGLVTFAGAERDPRGPGFDEYRITEKGREVLERARRAGW